MNCTDLHSIELPWPDDPAEAGAALLDGATESAWLDGSQAASGCSLLARDPIFVVDQSPAHIAECRALDQPQPVDRDRSFWALLDRAVERTHVGTAAAPPDDRSPRFGPGWVGYCGFELADQIESLPPARVDSLAMPLGRWAYYAAVIELDHARRRARALGRDQAATRDLARRWSANLESAARLAPPYTPHARARETTSAAEFEQAVRRVLDYIAAGDIYQVNLAHALELDHLPSAAQAFRNLRRENPAPYAALLQWPGAAIVSASPELFLEKRGVHARTCPIKGTRPRAADDDDDQRAVADLLRSEKEAAELAMIVDLHRNDLGRACKPGSVRVVDPRRVEAHPHIWHTVAEIAGEVEPGISPVELLRRMFPAGSVSGVPKIRALQIIRELEALPRGAYTGGLGWIGDQGDMIVNVAIRTLQMRGESGLLHLGSGIVIDSDPAAEYLETLAKGRGILRAIGAAPTPRG
ncbi:MAG: anthranilate synthase component I family protein [Phycisphaerae bacterium]|nr:anthranilate synthase component I family protein [Phycisphaerae bacterium]